jgi:uncharacterized protein (TIGR00661 family)
MDRKKILYGFQGDGRGHLSRAEVLSRELARHHDVIVLTTDEGAAKLSQDIKKLAGVKVIAGIFSPKLYFRANKINAFQTALRGIVDVFLKGIPGLFIGIGVYLKYRPDIIISDLEPFTSWLAFITGTRFISFDHQHILTECKIAFGQEHRLNYISACLMVRSFVPRSKINVITSFFFPPVKNTNTYIFKPIMRKEVVDYKGKVKEGNFILVYQTTNSTFKILDRALKAAAGEKFVVYNMGREYTEQNVTYKAVSVDNFINDLSSCKAVICNGGFTLISEALFLGKPVLAIPILNSFEQVLNSIYLDRLGYGQFSREFTVPEIKRFTDNLEKFRENISQDDFYGNKDIVNFMINLV